MPRFDTVSSEPLGPPVITTASLDPRRELVERIFNSAALRKSPRLRELFRYLAECALGDHPSPITEQQVGVAVFHRQPNYDTNVDTIVRVQISQLRKKLEHYFLAEGHDEPVVIDVPRGSYLLVFQPRPAHPKPVGENAAAHALPDEIPAKTLKPAVWLSSSFLLKVFLAAAIALCGWLAFQNIQLRKNHGVDSTPNVGHFWIQAFQNGLPTQIVPSDAGLTMVADLYGRTLSLNEYRSPGYPDDFLSAVDSLPKVKWIVSKRGTSNPVVGAGDAQVIHYVSVITGRYHILSDVISTREFQTNLGAPENIILLGHNRSNPWVELFQDRLNFLYSYDGATHIAKISNLSPLPGEQKEYITEWKKTGYCVVAYLPKPGGGNALLIIGGDMSAIQIGGFFVSDEKSMANLHSSLGVGMHDRLPYFEILLQTKMLFNTASDAKIVALRSTKN